MDETRAAVSGPGILERDQDGPVSRLVPVPGLSRCQGTGVSAGFPSQHPQGPVSRDTPWWAGSVLTRAELMLVVTGDVSRWPMIAYGDRCWICDLQRTKFFFGTKHSTSVTWSFIFLQ